MKNYEQFKRLILFLSAFIILTLQTAVYWVVWTHYYNAYILQPYFRRGNYLMVAVYALLLLFFSKIYGSLKVGYYKKNDIFFSQVLGLFFVNGITYLQICLLGLRFMSTIPLLVMTGIEVVLIIFWTIISSYIYKRLFPPHKMILLYGNRPAERLIKKMSSRSDKYEICAAMNIDKGIENIKKVINDFDAVIIWDIPSEVRSPILKYCFKNSIRTYVMPKLSDIILMGSDKINLFDTPLLLCRNYGLTFDQKFVKRFMDIMISFLALIVLSPIMLMISLLIKLYDRGPVFYKQERLTIDGHIFSIYKFRSMIVDAEKDGVARLAGQKDNRITPVGSFIRAVRIDELPQLINILAGHMSIVGPRPERPQIADEYKVDMPEFEFRLKVKAGLTGYAQVYGKYNTTPYDKLKLDLLYIESYSLWLDIKLIILTIKILFKKESTEGIDEGQNTARIVNYENNELVSRINLKEF
ncbi:MAG: hypothetical protein K0S47_4020 [Herbinix sp.]|jgi:exopolysaccharide biosynthesis polyprenyl glycosylphosphotransferase|nr:hypothetical protein [Herbinix sp.]